MSAGVDAIRFVSCPEVSFSCLPTALHAGSIVVLDCSDSALLYSNLLLQRVHVVFVSFIGNNAILTWTQLVLMWIFVVAICCWCVWFCANTHVEAIVPCFELCQVVFLGYTPIVRLML